jgi:hypothetical protein
MPAGATNFLSITGRFRPPIGTTVAALESLSVLIRRLVAAGRAFRHKYVQFILGSSDTIRLSKYEEKPKYIGSPNFIIICSSIERR